MSSAKELTLGLGQGLNSADDQYLTFFLHEEEYGVDILRVQEIKCWEVPTEIPNTPKYIQGVINIRGVIVPIIDLRERFHLPQVEYGPTTVMIILNVKSASRERVMGIVVDAVSDVYNIVAEQIKEAPDFGGAISTRFIQGLATVHENMVIILDTDKLLNSDELAVLDNVST